MNITIDGDGRVRLYGQEDKIGRDEELVKDGRPYLPSPSFLKRLDEIAAAHLRKREEARGRNE